MAIALDACAGQAEPLRWWRARESALTGGPARGGQEVEVSADCLDMLTRLLVAEPGARMTMEQIKVHRWFQRGLPPGALEMNDFLLQGLADMDEVVQPAPGQPACPALPLPLPRARLACLRSLQRLALVSLP